MFGRHETGRVTQNRAMMRRFANCMMLLYTDGIRWDPRDSSLGGDNVDRLAIQESDQSVFGSRVGALL